MENNKERNERIKKIKKEIKEGTYHVSNEKFAEKLLKKRTQQTK